MADQWAATNGSEVYGEQEDNSYLMLDIFGFVIIPIIVCGNLLIISAVCRFKTLRYSSNIMILFLAVGDLLMGGVYMPLKLLLFHSGDLFTERFPCLLNIFSGYFSVTTAMFFLSMLSIERFYAVQFPFHYHTNMTVMRSVLLCVVTLAVSFCITVPIICGIDTWFPGRRCFGNDILPSLFVLTVVSAVFVVSLLGFLAFCRVLAAEIRIRIQDKTQSETRRQDSVKSTLVLTVYVFSLLCWVPQLAYLIVTKFSPWTSSLLGLRSVSFLGVCSSGVNCFIYGIKNSKFREAFKLMFGCKLQQIHPTFSTRHTTH